MTNWSKLPNTRWLIENGGNVELGSIGPADCAVVASDEHNMLAALVRRPGESLDDLLILLEKALDRAVNHDEYIDETNRD